MEFEDFYFKVLKNGEEINTLSLPFISGYDMLTITGNCEWKAEVSTPGIEPQWCWIIPSHGLGDNQSVAVLYGNNLLNTPKTATITFYVKIEDE